MTPVHQLGHAHQDFLGVTAAQLAGPPEGAGIDDGYLPTSLTAGIGDALGCSACSDHNHINGGFSWGFSRLFGFFPPFLPNITPTQTAYPFPTFPPSPSP